MQIEKCKLKLNFISTPTKFHEMEKLRTELSCKPRLFIKRDDLTEIGLGGNKTRKLEYIMYEALQKAADCIITCGGEQSNHVRQTIAYANLLGMEAHVVVSADPKVQKTGNLFLFDVLGATVYFVNELEQCESECKVIEQKLIKIGKNPYIIPLGASTPLGSMGYIESASEIASQSKELQIKPQALFVASSSAATQAGLEIGSRLYMPFCKVYGIAVSCDKKTQQEKVAKLINETCKYLSLNIDVRSEDVCIYDEYFGGKYAVPTKECIEAIKLVGRTEAIILDPVYSGKAMSGMLDLLRKGQLDCYESVVFVHTGGSPAIHKFTEYF